MWLIYYLNVIYPSLCVININDIDIIKTEMPWEISHMTDDVSVIFGLFLVMYNYYIC